MCATWQAGRLTAVAHPVYDLQRVAGDHYYRFGDTVKIDLGKDVDVVLMRQDPPFDLGHSLTGTWLLERTRDQTLIVNDPVSGPQCAGKDIGPRLPAIHAADFSYALPGAAKAFQTEYGAIVKPLHGNGGKAVFRIDADGSNLGALVELFGQVWPEPFGGPTVSAFSVLGRQAYRARRWRGGRRDQPHAG